MLDRIVAGEVADKHHVALRDADGRLRHEECLTRRGFDGPYTIAYHVERPQTHLPSPDVRHGWPPPEPPAARRPSLAKRHIRALDAAPAGGPPVDARVPLLWNDDVILSVARPDAPDPVYVVNADGDELLFVAAGRGIVRSPLGDLRYEPHDYVCLPRGLAHRLVPDAGVAQALLAIECAGGLAVPPRFRNEAGQLRMDAPYSHRDFRRPTFRGPLDEGIRELVVKRGGAFHGFRLAGSPLDVVGWDGTVYPWALPILRFQPRAGQVHLPPDAHTTFTARGAIVCSFVPRVVDFHPEAIPCPYPHSSVDCDEVLFYARGEFTSRRGVGPGSLTLHPSGLAHGPHPGAYEASLGTTRTEELAVMIDTFRPLQVTARAAAVEDDGYMESFR